MKTRGTGIANGKIILMGEHSVIYGEPAIAFPFKAACIQATITEDREDTLFSVYYNGQLKNAPSALKNIKHLLQTLKQKYSAPNLTLTLESTIPAERGMGSSAATAVAITRAFFDWLNLPLDKSTLLYYVNQSEKIAHGNPSGIDGAATSGEMPIYFQKGAPFQEFLLNIDACLVVADTGKKGRTRDTVRAVAQAFEQNRQETAHTIQQLGSLAERAKEAISKNQPLVLGEVMNLAQTALQALQVSDGTLDHLIETARTAGALGAKLTGGGRGGCLIALAADQTQAQNIAKKLSDQGATATWVQELGVYQHV
ncbi:MULTISPECIES: mevalonate kinase [Enterococcus]|uniref:mevalonate kinase n=1 Tax=Enterococcus TaxID=1350 RepID=UPI00065E0A0D|nr:MULTISPECIES: mevalonate kinase [Enterococcus]KAF1301009.1 mevalonate kinase [Enterococcus sp. JM9B]